MTNPFLLDTNAAIALLNGKSSMEGFVQAKWIVVSSIWVNCITVLNIQANPPQIGQRSMNLRDVSPSRNVLKRQPKCMASYTRNSEEKGNQYP